MSTGMIRASTRITSSVSFADIPTMQEIMETSKSRNLDLKLQKVGPFFRITAKNLETNRELGRAEGVIRFWFDGKILHLDSIRLSKETLSMQRSIFGVGLFLGAVAVRHGFDSACNSAQLLAINDTDLYHSKVFFFFSFPSLLSNSVLHIPVKKNPQIM